MTPLTRILIAYLAVPCLCDGCDRMRKGVTSPDGRTLVCPRCRWAGWRYERRKCSLCRARPHLDGCPIRHV